MGAIKQNVQSLEPPSIEQLVLAGTHQGGMTARETRRHYLAMEDGSSVENPPHTAATAATTADGHSGSEAGLESALQFSQGFSERIASGVPLEALVHASPEYDDKPISDTMLDSLLHLTGDSEKEVMLAKQPFPSISMLGKQLDANLKRACAIQISVQRLVVMQSSSSTRVGTSSTNARTVTRPFRAAERNWEIQFDRRELQTTLEIDGEAQSNVDGLQDDHAPVFSCLSLASNRRLDEERLAQASDPHRRGQRKRQPITTIDFEQDRSGVAPEIPIKFDDRTVASWLSSDGTGEVSFQVRCYRIQSLTFKYSRLAQQMKSCRWQVQDHGAGAY